MHSASDPLPALKPLATLLAKRKITAREFDAAVAYLSMSEDRRTALHARMPNPEGKIVQHLLKLHPADAVLRSVRRCRQSEIVPRLRKALGQLNALE